MQFILIFLKKYLNINFQHLEKISSLHGESFSCFLLPQVDIDIKLRSCKGSCERYSAYQMEVGSYVALEKQVRWS